ncbi:hypothetical protein NP233_g10692 [Leucocoprinus birnbaumii]|uniref:Uncharacterized protein n=1 Tax=Leucocoprinus birnbaumii TaxID=56174 RepID=A0AAD5YPL1_9AGAR|nr:hypothetical protein NP233_g10692 [Leucocoprinus birnbaumii]
MVEIPDFREDSSIVRAAKVWDCPSLGFDDSFKVIQLIRRSIRGNDTATFTRKVFRRLVTRESGQDLRSKEVISREMLEASNGGVKEIHDLSMLLVIFAVTSNIKRRGACGMLGELRDR